MPCRHAVAFAQRHCPTVIGSSEQWLGDHFRKLFQVESLTAAYAVNIRLPLSDDIVADGTTLPAPLVAKTKGANRKRRFKSAGEGTGGRVGKAKRTSQCSRCGGDGHNVRSCTNVPSML